MCGLLMHEVGRLSVKGAGGRKPDGSSGRLRALSAHQPRTHRSIALRRIRHSSLGICDIAVLGRKHEDGLGQIHLPGQALHLAVAGRRPVFEHHQMVALQRRAASTSMIT
jgi:hypothetical protein